MLDLDDVERSETAPVRRASLAKWAMGTLVIRFLPTARERPVPGVRHTGRGRPHRRPDRRPRPQPGRLRHNRPKANSRRPPTRVPPRLPTHQAPVGLPGPRRVRRRASSPPGWPAPCLGRRGWRSLPTPRCSNPLAAEATSDRSSTPRPVSSLSSSEFGMIATPGTSIPQRNAAPEVSSTAGIPRLRARAASRLGRSASIPAGDCRKRPGHRLDRATPRRARATPQWRVADPPEQCPAPTATWSVRRRPPPACCELWASGQARPESYELHGPFASRVLADLLIDHLILGVDSIDAVLGTASSAWGGAVKPRWSPTPAR